MVAKATVFAFLFVMLANPAYAAMRAGYDPFCGPPGHPGYPPFRPPGLPGNYGGSYRLPSGAVFSPGQRTGIKPVADSRLKNALRFSTRLFTGAAPESDEALMALKDLGVQTIISVEGAQPDAERAKKLGLRYIHLPLSFEGIPAGRALELAKAVRDFPGPVYIHCSCGVDRSPAAAAVASVLLGDMSPDNAVAAMKTCGVSEGFAGLYGAAASARKASDQTLNELKVQFWEKAEVTPVAKAMATIRKTGARLAAASHAEWKTPAGRADNDSRASARELLGLITTLRNSNEVKRQSDEFRRLLTENRTAVAALAESLEGQKAPPTAQELVDINARFEKVGSSCVSCHVQFRDIKPQELLIGRRGE